MGSTFGIQVTNSYPVTVTVYEGKRPCVKPWCRVVDNMKKYLSKNVWVKLIHVAEWWSSLNMELNLQVPYNKFLTSNANIFSRTLS